MNTDLNPATSPPVRGLVFSLKLTAGAAILLWLYRSDYFDPAVVQRISPDFGSVGLLLAGSTLLASGAILISIRLWLLLRLLGTDLAWRDTLRINLAAMCLGMMLPGLVGVDAIRLTGFCLIESRSRTTVFAAVVLDRVLGIFALLVLSTLGVSFALATGFDRIPAGLLQWLLPPVGGGVLLLLLFGSQSLKRWRIMLWLQSRLPARVGRAMASLQVVAKSYRVLGGCLLLSLISQMFTVLSFVFIGLVIQDRLPILLHFIINPLALLLNGIPITPGGLGITESAFAYLFQLAGSENGAVIALLGRLNQYLVYAIIGIPVLLTFKLKTLQTLRGR